MKISDGVKSLEFDLKSCGAPFQGWGTSLAWFGHSVGRWSEERKKEVADLLFSSSGLGLNVIRYNIGGGDHPDHSHMRPGGDVPGYLSADGIWDWDADAGQRWMLLAARERGANMFEAFSNSPPYWMTISGCAAGEPAGQNNLRPENYEAFADYLTEVLLYFKNTWGLTFQTLNPLNEPASFWWKEGNRQEGCHFDPIQQAEMIKQVNFQLIHKGLYGETHISAPDETSIDYTLQSFEAYDDIAKGMVSQINTHSYEGHLRTELRQLADRHGKVLWMSEYGTGGDVPHNHDDVRPGLQLSSQILKDMKEMRPAAWVYWQAVEDEGVSCQEDSNWGFLHADMSGSSEVFHHTKQYYFMLQFTKCLRPGCRFLEVSDTRTLAAWDEKAHTLTVVFHNEGPDEDVVKLALDCPESIPELQFRTSARENAVSVDVVRREEQELFVTLAADSVTTCVFKLL